MIRQLQTAGSDFQEAADFLLLTVAGRRWQFATNLLPLGYGFV